MTTDEIIEAAFWDFDARRKGDGPYKHMPQSERDAFKLALRQAIDKLVADNEAKDALLRQALEALEQHCMAYYRHEEYRDDAIAAIKEHLNK